MVLYFSLNVTVEMSTYWYQYEKVDIYCYKMQHCIWGTLTDSHVRDLKGHNTQHSGHASKKVQNELIGDIFSNSLVRAIGKALHMKFS